MKILIAFTASWLLGLGHVAIAQSSGVSVYQLNSTETYIQAPLEQEIYFYTRDAQLNDLQVQDAQGNNLPFRLIDVSSYSQKLNRESPARFFPVEANTSEEKLRTLSSTSIHINTDKVQVDIEESTGGAVAAVDIPDFYLIDIREFQNRSNTTELKLKSLALEWNQLNESSQNQYQIWELSVSNDLRDWRFISSNSLVKLEKEGQSLIQNEIPLGFDYQDYAYLKLRCVEFCNNLQLSQINIMEESTERFFPADAKWNLQGEKSTSQKSIKLANNDSWQSQLAWNFQRKDHAPIEKFSVSLGSQIYGDKIRLLGRSRSQDPWALVYQGIWFNTKVGSEWFASSPMPVYGHHTEFRLELAGKIQAEFTPELVFYTQGKVIQFIGNQASPYQLRVAEQGTQAQARILDALLKDQSPNWVQHQWTFLNPARPEAASTISTASLVFWGLLILACLLLGLMAVKLLKQMNSQPK